MIVGEMFTFSFVRNHAFWQFYLLFKTGSYGALSFIHVL